MNATKLHLNKFRVAILTGKNHIMKGKGTMTEKDSPTTPVCINDSKQFILKDTKTNEQIIEREDTTDSHEPCA